VTADSRTVVPGQPVTYHNEPLIPHDQRQSIPIVKPNIVTHMIAMLDATLAIRNAIRPHVSFVPGATDFPAIDEAVRLWASANGMHLIDWGHWSTPQWWIEGIKVAIDAGGIGEIVTLHTPHELRRREPKAVAADNGAPIDVPAQSTNGATP
jgi:hypothetical protein